MVEEFFGKYCYNTSCGYYRSIFYENAMHMKFDHDIHDYINVCSVCNDKIYYKIKLKYEM